jgi:hypothetical protein
MAKKIPFNYNIDDVFSASCGAERINNGYVKYQLESGSENNISIMHRLLIDPTSIEDIDKEQGNLVRQYYQGLTFKILQGKKLSNFDNIAMKLSDKESITSSYDLAIIASLPSSFKRSKKLDDDNRRLRNTSGGFVGKIGDKVRLNVEVIKKVFSYQWGVNFISCITEDDQAVFFSYRKEDLDIGQKISIQGTVKSHNDNTTKLNRVKTV